MELLLLVTLFIVVLKYAIGKVGKDTIAARAYNVYLQATANRDYQTLHASKAELREISRQKMSISAQDQYAKWTKLNRKHDKLKLEVDRLEKAIVAKQAGAVSRITMFLTFVSSVPLWYYRVFRRKDVLLYLPRGAFPAVVEYWLAFPSVSRGAIGLGGWIFVVDNLINLAEFLVQTLVLDEKVAPPNVSENVKANTAAKGAPKVEELEVDEVEN